MYMRIRKLKLWFRLLVCFFRKWFILPENDEYLWDTKTLQYDIQYQEAWDWVWKDVK